MKIAFMISSLTGGGAERVAINLTHYFQEQLKDQVDCDLIVLNNIGDYSIEEAIFINERYSQNPFKKALFHFWLYPHKLRKIKKEKQYDAVISFTPLPNRMNIKSNAGEKSIISVRNYTSLIHSQKVQNILRKEYPRADKIIAVSEKCKEDLQASLGLDPALIKCIYNPYPISTIIKEGALSIPDEEAFLFENKETIISIGRFSDQKAFWRIIKAVAVMKETLPNIKLVLMGKEEGGSKNQAFLELLVNRFRLESNVHFVGFKENPFAYIQRSQVFVLCSQYEGFPNALTEAMCLGVPVVSTDCLSGPREILAPELDLSTSLDEIMKASSGILVPQYPADENREGITKNDKMLAASILELIQDEEMRKHYSEAAKQRAKDFEVGVIANQWIAEINELIK